MKKISLILLVFFLTSFYYPSFIKPGNRENKISLEEFLLEKNAKKIDSYFCNKSMPLAGYGRHFALVAKKYGLPYNLLPAIAVKESSGGKKDRYCNPFGWGSCKIRFSNYYEAIEVVAERLTFSPYYKNKSLEGKLSTYNRYIGYVGKVKKIMKDIDLSESW